MMAAALGIEAEDVAEAVSAPMKAALDLFTPRPPED